MKNLKICYKSDTILGELLFTNVSKNDKRLFFGAGS